VTVPAKAGFGTSVIRDLIRYELGGGLTMCWLPQGSDAKWKFLSPISADPARKTKDLHRGVIPRRRRHWEGASTPAPDPNLK
jgi:hypothetical protein